MKHLGKHWSMSQYNSVFNTNHDNEPATNRWKPMNKKIMPAYQEEHNSSSIPFHSYSDRQTSTNFLCFMRAHSSDKKNCWYCWIHTVQYCRWYLMSLYQTHLLLYNCYHTITYGRLAHSDNMQMMQVASKMKLKHPPNFLVMHITQTAAEYGVWRYNQHVLPMMCFFHSWKDTHFFTIFSSKGVNSSISKMCQFHVCNLHYHRVHKMILEQALNNWFPLFDVKMSLWKKWNY